MMRKRKDSLTALRLVIHNAHEQRINNSAWEPLMTDLSLQTPEPDTRCTAADLAQAAGAFELSAGAAVAGAEGRRFRARLLADELAAGHRVMMRLAAQADDAIAGASSLDGRFALPFDLLAARFAGTAGRLMDQFRRGAVSLPKIAGPDGEGEDRWVGVCFENENLCSPEEADRRLAAAKAARAAARRESPDPKAPPPTPDQLAAVARADEAARQLAAAAEAAALTTRDDPAARQRLFLDQLAAGHRMMMRLAGRADRQIDCLGAPGAEPEPARRAVLRLSSAMARLTERVRLGLLALDRMGVNPDGGPGKVTGYYWIGERDLFASDRTVPPANDVGGSQKAEARSQKAARRAAEPSPAGPGPAAGTFCLPSSDFCLLNRGRLKNGNPSGDYMTAPRCGARTRAGCSCRQPAMTNGRCRFHGGKSTGPRTEAGRERARTARLVHGFRSAEIIDLRKAAAATSRRLRALLGSQKSEARNQKASAAGTPSNPAALALPDGTFCLQSSDFRLLIPAGHGVDRHVLRLLREAA
jgi:hypothetical protein